MLQTLVSWAPAVVLVALLASSHLFGTFTYAVFPVGFNNGYVYLPQLDGTLKCVNQISQELVWQFDVGEAMSEYGYTPIVIGGVNLAANVRLAFDAETTYIATRMAGLLIAIEQRTGSVKWLSKPSEYPRAIIMQIRLIKDDLVVLLGKTGGELLQDDFGQWQAPPTNDECYFFGGIAILNATNGDLLSQKTRCVPL